MKELGEYTYVMLFKKLRVLNTRSLRSHFYDCGFRHFDLILQLRQSAHFQILGKNVSKMTIVKFFFLDLKSIK